MRHRLAAALALLCLAAACFALRSLGFEEIFGRDGTVALDLGDGAYHARLVAWAFAHFPAFLTFDPYLSGPSGGTVVWPPLFDLTVAGAARALGVGATGTDAVLAWSGPVLGVVAVLAVYAGARSLAGRGTALGAAALYASFGITNEYGAVGNGDHHAFVVTIASIWLMLSLAFVASPHRGRLVLIGVGLGVIRAAMITAWGGSILYLALADGALVLVCVLSRDPRRLAVFGLGAWLSTLLAAPIVWQLHDISGGLWSAVSLSYLHLALVAGLGAAALGIAAVEARWPSRTASECLLRLVGVAVFAAVVAIASPALRPGLMRAYRFLTLRDAAGAATFEQMPLFTLFGRAGIRSPQTTFGWLAYFVLVAPLAPFLIAEPSARAPAGLLAMWAAFFSVLAMTQVRYANDFAAPGAICFALMIAWPLRSFRNRPVLRWVLAVAIGLALVWPCAVAPMLAYGPTSWRAAISTPPGGDPLLKTVSGTLVRFAQMVREATPETPGYLDAGTPEYGVIGNPNIGHTLRHYSRRPVVTDNFWDWFPAFSRAAPFGDFDDEGKATALLDELRVRYVVTIDSGGHDHATVIGRLEADDGNGSAERAPLTSFRLITEGPRGGRSFEALAGRRSPTAMPYKLFEKVRGATIMVPAAAGTLVEAEITIATPAGRQFVYRTSAETSSDGIAMLRLPYSTQVSTPAHSTGPWRLRAADRSWSMDVSDAQVVNGAVLRTR